MNESLAIDSLRKHFTDSLGLSGESISWLLKLYEMIQFFDDVADSDHISRDRLDKAINLAIYGMPDDVFYRKYYSILSPVLINAILKWQASDKFEKNGNANEKSFMWRASYYDVVMMVVFINHGMEVASDVSVDVMNMYGEKLSDYLKEFENA